MYTKEDLEKIKETKNSLNKQIKELNAAGERVREHIKKAMPQLDSRAWYEWDYNYKNFDTEVSGEGEFDDSFCDYKKENQIYALRHESGAYGWWKITLISIPENLLYMTDEELDKYADDLLKEKEEKEQKLKKDKEDKEKEKRRLQYEKLKEEFGE